jgi:hypothetical protein
MHHTAYSNGKKKNEILDYIWVDYSRLTLDYGVPLCSARFLLKHMEVIGNIMFFIF